MKRITTEIMPIYNSGDFSSVVESKEFAYKTGLDYYMKNLNHVRIGISGLEFTQAK